MDAGKGHLRMIDSDERDDLMNRQPTRTDIFSVGEVVALKGSRFRITKITPKKITLRVLPKGVQND